jgi:hypothetical protein
MRRALAALLLAVALAVAGCGGGDGERGTATLWVTRDRGAVLLHETEVPAGQTLMRALRAVADVETRFGGRFVQAIDGIEGSLTDQHDWFWFVNGYEGDRSAAEYRLHDGDVAWFDYRRWEREGEVRFVVGAFPEPLLHGYDGEVRPFVVLHAPGLQAAAEHVGRELGAADVLPAGSRVDPAANVLELVEGEPQLRIEPRSGSGRAGSPVRIVFAGDVDDLLAGRIGRRSYTWPD